MLVILLALLLAPPAGPATARADDDITIGGQMFRLGMPRSEAMVRLNACCKLAGSNDSFFIESKDGPPFSILGAVWFRGGRVSALRLDRARSDDAKTVAFVLGLYRVLSDVAPGTSVASVGTSVSELSNGTTRTITIRLQTSKVLTISVHNPDDGSAWAELSEER
jgi:hypothetical protein